MLSSRLRTQNIDCEPSLTPFRRWLGLHVPTARPNSSTGAGWIMPASLGKRRRIGAGLLRFIQRTEAGSPTTGRTYWLLGKPVRLKRDYAVSTANFAGFSFVPVLCGTDREKSLNGTERTRILKSGNVPRRPSGRMNRAYA